MFNPTDRLSAFIRTTTETQRVQIPSRKSEMLCLVGDMSSKTADVPSPTGDWALIPPNGTATATVDLAFNYDLSAAGDYEVALPPGAWPN